MKPKKKERSIFHKSVNVAIFLAVTIFVLLFLFFGFSQTKTFRNYLKETITENVNSSINGKLDIGRIDGSIFTSLRINDVSLQSLYDTVATVKKIDIEIRPLQILLKKIYLREIEIKGLNFNLREVMPGKYNVATLSRDTTEETSGDLRFPFLIQANNIVLSNISFTKQNLDNIKSQRNYNSLNIDDLRIDDLNLKAKAQVDINNKDFQLVINNFSFNTNILNFDLKRFSGAFHVDSTSISIKKLKTSTLTSNINLNLDVNDINIFRELNLSEMEKIPVTLDLNAQPFSFGDLYAIVPEVDMLVGETEFSASAKGTLGNLDINRFLIEYDKTRLDLTGSVVNLVSSDQLYFDVSAKNSNINLEDINSLLPTLELPVYKTLALNNFNLRYRGTPTNFIVGIDAKIGNGRLKLDSKLDFSKPQLIYDVVFDARNLDISEVLQYPTILNTKGNVTGLGTDPTLLQAGLKLESFKTKLYGYNIDSLKLNVVGKAKIIQLDLTGLVNNSKTIVGGSLDLTNSLSPAYNLTGSFKNLDLSQFTNDTSYSTSLNFNFQSNGRDLDLDKMVGDFKLDFDASVFKTTFFEDASLELKLSKSDSLRQIDLISNFVDFNISGNFSLQDAVEVLTYQGIQNTQIIQSKIKELNPVSNNMGIIDTTIISPIDTSITNKKIDFDYRFKFKDFDLIAAIIGQEELGIAGVGGGSVKNNSTNFSINTNLKLDYFYTLTDNEILYLSNLDTDLNFSRDNRNNSFDNLFGALSVGSDRIVAGSMVKNFSADFVFNQSKLIFNLYTEIDTFLTTSIDGNMLMRPGQQLLTIEDANIDYKDIAWTNRGPLALEFSTDSILFKDFTLYNDSSFFDLKGIFTSIGNNNLVFKAGNIPGHLLSYYLSGTYDQEFRAQTNLITNFSGKLADPRLTLNFQINDINYGNKELGNFYCVANYFKENLDVDLKFVDSLSNLRKPYFYIKGDIPVNLAIGTPKPLFDSSKVMNIKFIADSLNLNSFGNLLPTIKNQKGILKGNINLTGPINDIVYDGKLTVRKANFLSDLNDLEYKFGMILNFDKNRISVDSLAIANLKGSKLNGSITGNGFILLDGFTPKEIDLKFNGGLGVLGKRSRSVSPMIYGNLYLEVKDTWRYTLKENKNKFIGTVLLKEADLTFSPIQTGYNSTTDIVYSFKVDSSKMDTEEIKFDKLVTSKQKKVNSRVQESLTNFDYSVNVLIDDEAKIDFILSPSFNQKLVVLAEGNMLYETIDNSPRAQGEFRLLEGSKLEFFKVFDAVGSIRFETKVTDPNLDVVATYTSEYYQTSDQTVSSTPFAVKIKINGTFSELGKNLASSKDNIQVYIGARNIADDISEAKYDAKNALSFILVGKPDLTDPKETKNLAQSLVRETADSFLGSALTSLVNTRVGDAINDIQLSTTGQYTRFNVSGKFENVRYSVGGTEQVFQNFSSFYKANLRVEYLFDPNFLIRLERKTPLTGTTGTEDKINELGLKYILAF